MAAAPEMTGWHGDGCLFRYCSLMSARSAFISAATHGRLHAGVYWSVGFGSCQLRLSYFKICSEAWTPPRIYILPNEFWFFHRWEVEKVIPIRALVISGHSGMMDSFTSFFSVKESISRISREHVGSRLKPSRPLTASKNVHSFVVFEPNSTSTPPTFLFQMEDTCASLSSGSGFRWRLPRRSCFSSAWWAELSFPILPRLPSFSFGTPHSSPL